MITFPSLRTLSNEVADTFLAAETAFIVKEASLNGHLACVANDPGLALTMPRWPAAGCVPMRTLWELAEIYERWAEEEEALADQMMAGLDTQRSEIQVKQRESVLEDAGRFRAAAGRFRAAARLRDAR
jgi:hypothetical protein